MMKILYSKTDGEVRQTFSNPEQPHFAKEDEEVLLIEPPTDFDVGPQFFKVVDGKLVANQEELDAKKVIVERRKNEDAAIESMAGMTFEEFQKKPDSEKWQLMFSAVRAARRRLRM